MIILDIKTNTQYDLSSINGQLLDAQFGDGTITSFSEWDAMGIAPQHKGNYQTWENALIKIFIKASSRIVLEKRISWAKALFNYADVYLPEMGFDFHFKGEITGAEVKYMATNAVLTIQMQGRKLSTEQVITFNFANSTTGTARINWLGNTKVPLRIDMTVPAGNSTPASIALVAKTNNGVELWSEKIELTSFTPSVAGTVTLDGRNGVFYFTSASGRENWVEKYKAKFLPYVESRGDILVVSISGTGITDMKLSFEGRWI